MAELESEGEQEEFVFLGCFWLSIGKLVKSWLAAFAA